MFSINFLHAKNPKTLYIPTWTYITRYVSVWYMMYSAYISETIPPFHRFWPKTPLFSRLGKPFRKCLTSHNTPKHFVSSMKQFKFRVFFAQVSGVLRTGFGCSSHRRRHRPNSRFTTRGRKQCLTLPHRNYCLSGLKLLLFRAETTTFQGWNYYLSGLKLLPFKAETTAFQGWNHYLSSLKPLLLSASLC